VPLSAAAPAPRFFHGYVMLGVAMMMAVASTPGQSILVSVFNDSIRADLGISVATISVCYAIGTISAAFPLPLVGRLADRFGLRVVVGLVTLAFAGGLLLLSRAAGVVTLTLGFFLVRLLGQGSLGMLSGHTLAMWFERTLGRMDAIKTLGFAIGGAVLPTPTLWLIGVVGWRTALPILAAGVVALLVPLVLTVFRNKPEDIGQHLDGDPVEYTTHDVLHGGEPPPGDPAFTLREAMARRAYWILVCCAAWLGVVGTAGLFHMQPMLESAGADPSDANKAIAPFPTTAAIFTLLGGVLIDRFPPHKLLPIGPLLCTVASLVWLGAMHEGINAPPVASMGLGMGLCGVAHGIGMSAANPTLARYFGRTHHGAIRGVMGMMIVGATGLGPIAAGAAYEWSGGTFVEVVIAFAGAGVPLTLAALMLRRPRAPVR